MGIFKNQFNVNYVMNFVCSYILFSITMDNSNHKKWTDFKVCPGISLLDETIQMDYIALLFINQSMCSASDSQDGSI